MPAGKHRAQGTPRKMGAELARAHAAAHIPAMPDRPPPTLDMTPEGEFLPPRPEPRFVLGWKARAVLIALGSSFVVGVVASVALLFYVALLALPVVVIAGAMGYLSQRGSPRRDVYRP